MYDKLPEKAQKLYDLLYTKDFHADYLIAQLKEGTFSKEDVNLAALRYVDDCPSTMSYHDYEGYRFGEEIPGLESSHLLEAIRILLDYGLDPNMVIDGYENIMSVMRFVFNGYQSADAMALMFEHGGNPSILIDGESLIRELNTDINWFLGDVDERYVGDAYMHYWMVFIGYGAKLEDGRDCIDPCGDFDPSAFKNHRQYYFGFIHSDRSDDHWELSFFDKATNWEVARY